VRAGAPALTVVKLASASAYRGSVPMIATALRSAASPFSRFKPHPHLRQRDRIQIQVVLGELLVDAAAVSVIPERNGIGQRPQSAASHEQLSHVPGRIRPWERRSLPCPALLLSGLRAI